MSNYIVSARKYRPDTFESVVGQENITRTLKNAIKQQHLAQAYLFCGPRGVGKTTNARIFAKTINCYNLDENTNPCNECESCKAFNQQRSMNIHELDAASNNSVEDIRNLIDQVRIPPQIGKYSVYIIDEVHMLSSSAFNAFLKTLEEPPKHAVFILATTEKHKILPTILSRCQVYDFNRITVTDIVNRLKFVAEEEHIQTEEEALQIIAQKADGAMRDALSIFDQIVSFSGANLTYQDAIDNLNVLDYDYYFRLTDALQAADHINSLLIFNEILGKGFEGNYFITGLAEHLRDILISKDTKSAELLEVGSSIRETYMLKAANTSEEFLIKALDIASDCDYKYKASHNKRLHVELALIRMASLNKVRTEPKSNPQTTPQQVTKAEGKQVSQAQQASPTKETSSAKEEPQAYKKAEPPKSTQSAAEPPSVPKTKPMSFSIKTDVGKPDEEKQAENEIVRPKVTETKDFSQEELESAWKVLAEKQKNQPRLHQNLLSYLPQKKANNIIEVQLPSESLTKVIKQLRMDLLSDLQVSLNNGEIDLIISTAKTDDNAPRRAYTAEEKYKEMAIENPEIQNFRQAIDGNLR
ncbi:MAG: DNA polymerase III subunit gamma/tau [Bacteroidales bacterium]|jgi:DNA polymerase-3 subunit gamma/tau|nr:DNA polymerase III subunit gamma/tau [Bacteroidales bacterium]